MNERDLDTAASARLGNEWRFQEANQQRASSDQQAPQSTEKSSSRSRRKKVDDKRKDSSPDSVGTYQFGDLLGRGAFGKVWRCLDIHSGEFRAVKQIEKELIPDDQMPLINRELELLKKLEHHNVTKFVENLEDSKFIYFVLEYIEGGSLYKTMSRFGRFPETLLKIYIKQTLHGLAYLHDMGVIHRDIKGANILLTKEGKIKLADFGASTYAAIEKRTSVVGTPFWMAPEVIAMKGNTTSAADIWSLGCTVIELMTGEPPYYDMGPMAALFRMVEDPHPPLPSEEDFSSSAELKDFLLKCFTKNSEDRPSARTLLMHPWLFGIASVEDDAVSLSEMGATLRTYNRKNAIQRTSTLRYLGQKKTGGPALVEEPSTLDPEAQAIQINNLVAKNNQLTRKLGEMNRKLRQLSEEKRLWERRSLKLKKENNSVLARIRQLEGSANTSHLRAPFQQASDSPTPSSSHQRSSSSSSSSSIPIPTHSRTPSSSSVSSSHSPGSSPEDRPSWGKDPSAHHFIGGELELSRPLLLPSSSLEKVVRKLPSEPARSSSLEKMFITP